MTAGQIVGIVLASVFICAWLVYLVFTWIVETPRRKFYRGKNKWRYK